MISIYYLVKIDPVVLEKKMLTDNARRTTTDGNPLAISHLRDVIFESCNELHSTWKWQIEGVCVWVCVYIYIERERERLTANALVHDVEHSREYRYYTATEANDWLIR